MNDVAVMVVSTVIIALGIWVLVRQRSLRFSGRVQDVPDAPRTATPIDEPPGLTLPYSSLDPSGPRPAQPAARRDAEKS